MHVPKRRGESSLEGNSLFPRSSKRKKEALHGEEEGRGDDHERKSVLSFVLAAER